MQLPAILFLTYQIAVHVEMHKIANEQSEEEQKQTRMKMIIK